MAVQGQSKDISCPQCFEINPPGSTFCQLCGAPLSERGETVEGSDTEVYRELAQTNLLRMRGEYKDAAHVCLSILKRYPHNVTAHALLGDIYAEQGDLEQAAEWYEMALDLSPSAEAERAKLAEIRAKIHEREHAATDVQLEIPPAKPPKTGLMITLMALGVLAVGAAAYFLGSNFRNNNAQKAPVETPIVVTSSGSTAGSGNPPVDQGTRTASTDDAILDLLKKSGQEKDRYTGVVEDSRGPSLFVTVTATPNEDVHTVAVMTADDVFSVFAKYVMVTVRVMVDGTAALVADVERQKLDEVKNGLREGESLAAKWEELLTGIRSEDDQQPANDPPSNPAPVETTGSTGDAPIEPVMPDAAGN